MNSEQQPEGQSKPNDPFNEGSDITLDDCIGEALKMGKITLIDYINYKKYGLTDEIKSKLTI